MKDTGQVRIAQIIGKMCGGGVETVVMNYYRHIDHEKFQFDFLADADSTLVQKAEIESLGGRVIFIPPYQQIFAYQKELASLFRRERYPIVHSNINTLSVFPLLAAQRAGVPVRIAHNHSTAGKGEFTRNLMKYALRPFSKTFATHYCACTKHAGEWLFGEHTFAEGKVRVFRNAIDLEPFLFKKQIREEVRRELGLTDELVVGHVGRFMHQKNHAFLVEIFCEMLKQQPNAVLLLIGQGPLQEKIEALVHKRGVAECVRFLGQRADVARLYQAMDLFLFPSFYEGLGMVCIEAQTSGLPCLVSDQVPQEAKLLNSVVFFPLSATVTAWANQALKLLTRNDERKDCRKEVRAAGYDIQQAAKELEKFYISTLQDKS